MAPPPESLAGQREVWAEALYQHLLWQVYEQAAHLKCLQPHEELRPPDEEPESEEEESDNAN